MSKLFLAGLVVACVTAGSTEVRAQAPNGVAGLLPNLILNGIRLDAGTPVPHDAHFTPLNELYVGTDPRSGEGLPGRRGRGGAQLQPAAGDPVRDLPDRHVQRRVLLHYRRVDRPAGSQHPQLRALLRRTHADRRTRSLLDRVRPTSTPPTTSFEGENLDDGSIQFLLPHNDCCPAQVGLQATGDGNLLNPGFESDIVTVRVSMKATDRHRGVLCHLRPDRSAGTSSSPSRWSAWTSRPRPKPRSCDWARPSSRWCTRSRPGATSRAGRSPRPAAPAASATSCCAPSTTSRSGAPRGLRRPSTCGCRPAMPRTCSVPEPLQSRFGFVVSTGTDRFAQHVNVGYTFSGSTDVSTYIGDDPELAVALLPSDTPPDEFHFNGGVEFAGNRSPDAARRVHGAHAAQRGAPRDGRAVVHVHAAGPAGGLAGSRVAVVP